MSWGETLFLKKIIDGKRTLAGGDTPIAVFYSSTKMDFLRKTTLGTFTAKSNGVIRLKINGYRVTSMSYWGEVRLYSDDVIKGAVTPTSSTTSDNPSVAEMWTSADISIEKGKTYTIKADGVWTNAVQICASIVDGSLFNFSVRGDE